MNDPLDDLLDARFREETPYVDDDGFTTRVMRQLPRGRVSFRTQRSLIILAATIISAVVAYFASGQGMFIHEGLASLATFTPLQVLLLAAVCAMAMIIGGLWAALTRSRDLIM